MNKELVLREHLAIERTKLGNERTLLAYIRTGLYFVVAGSTLGELIGTRFWNVMDVPIVLVGFGIVIAGIMRFLSVKRMIERALEVQLSGAGFSFVEILTMCPTGWFIRTEEAPDYLADTLGGVHVGGVVKDALAS